MKEQILALKNLYDNGINKELFFKLILHVTNGYDGYNEPMRAYANYLDIENWEKLFSNPHIKISVTSSQLILFFEYMVNYYSKYFGKNQKIYLVFLDFRNNELRTEDNFKLEDILLTTFEII